MTMKEYEAKLTEAIEKRKNMPIGPTEEGKETTKAYMKAFNKKYFGIDLK